MTMVPVKREGGPIKKRECRYCGERVTVDQLKRCDECDCRICIMCAVMKDNSRYCEDCSEKLNIETE